MIFFFSWISQSWGLSLRDFWGELHPTHEILASSTPSPSSSSPTTSSSGSKRKQKWRPECGGNKPVSRDHDREIQIRSHAVGTLRHKGLRSRGLSSWRHRPHNEPLFGSGRMSYSRSGWVAQSTSTVSKRFRFIPWDQLQVSARYVWNDSDNEYLL